MTTWYRSVSRQPQELYLSKHKTLVEWAAAMRDKDIALQKNGCIFVPIESIDVPYEVWKPLSEDETDLVKFLEQTGGAMPPLIRKRG